MTTKDQTPCGVGCCTGAIFPCLPLHVQSTKNKLVRSTSTTIDNDSSITTQRTSNEKKRTTNHNLLHDLPGTYTSSTSPRTDSQLWWPQADPIAIPICRQCLRRWLRRQSRQAEGERQVRKVMAEVVVVAIVAMASMLEAEVSLAVFVILRVFRALSR